MELYKKKLYKRSAMEVTCWCCHAVFDPDATGKRCPHCGSHAEAWLSKIRFFAADFIGPIFLLGLGILQLHDSLPLAIMLVFGSLAWAAWVYFKDTGEWPELPGAQSNLAEQRHVTGSAPLSRPPMPAGWKQLSYAEREASSASGSSAGSPLNKPMRELRRLPWGERLLIAALIFGSIAYFVSRWRQLEDFVRSGNAPPAFITSLAIILCLIGYAVWRSRAQDQIVRNGVLTPGVLAGWYESRTYNRYGGPSDHVRIRYYFWTEAGQKFEGSGNLMSVHSLDNLSINQEPLKVFYLPQDPSKNVALCCTTARPGS